MIVENRVTTEIAPSRWTTSRVRYVSRDPQVKPISHQVFSTAHVLKQATDIVVLCVGLAKQASQITMYDVKSYYNQAKNMVLNVSETEAKVREATNDDPWLVFVILTPLELLTRHAGEQVRP